ncbi:ECF subfamily RNA polymerase sigma factor, BldN family [Kitasatospora sp. NPDC094028]
MYPPVRNDAPAPSRPSSLRPRTGLRARPAERQIATGLDLLRNLLRSQLTAASPQLVPAGAPLGQPYGHEHGTGTLLRTTAAGSAGTGSRGRTGTTGIGRGRTRTAPSPGYETEHNPIMELVERAQNGESEAFGRLYDHYADTVYRYIYYRVGSRATAEDLTSETFLRALRRIGTFTWQGRDFGAWLVTIARNLVADHFKSSRFRLEVTTGEMLDSNECERSPEESVLESLSNAALLDAVRRLNPQQQECVTLRFLQGLSVAETARIMGKNEGAIKTLQYRAVRTLARLLPPDAR